jgi:hypothetical protein
MGSNRSRVVAFRETNHLVDQCVAAQTTNLAFFDE